MIDEEEALQRLRDDPQMRRSSIIFFEWVGVLVACFAIAEVVAWLLVTGVVR